MSASLRRDTPASVLAERLLNGDRLALSRMISALEAARDDARQAMRCLYARTGRAHVVGVTGPPGSGKSTLTTRLAIEYRGRGRTVGIVAVDPTSPYSGGAILGDRVRMMELHSDPGVFMRSMATRGLMGGLARSTLDVVLLLDAFGKDVVILETVGVGQDEVEIARAADTTLVVGVPNLGDDIQAIKAGILEIADILVVNKADLAGADRLVADLRAMLQLGEQRTAWPTPIQQTVATDGQGVAELVDRIAEHRTFLEQSGTWRERRADSARRQVRAIVEDRVQRRLERLTAGPDWAARFASIAAREDDPYSVADEVLQEVVRDGQ
ncbi:MAG TPA: methylmalonyl Co-A mutase-associated GTPase MeaB [Chloroflexota bacterium]